MYSNNEPVVTEKTTKKKSNSKSKSPRVSKPNSNESSASSIAAAIKDVSAYAPNPTNLTPSSSTDMHKFVLQHQQLMAKQYEQQVRQESPQSSQLFKLLSPGAESDNITSPGLPPTSGTPDSTAETRTAIISKQSLVSNMSLPMIRLSRSEDNSQQSPIFVTASSLSGASMLSSLPPGDTAEKIVLRTGDKSIMKLTQADLKNLIAGGRGIQLFTGLPGQSPVNILVKKSEDCNPTSSASIPDAAIDSSATILPSIGPVSTPSLVLPTTDTSKLINLTQAVIPSVIEPQITAVLATSSIPEEITAVIESSVEQAEGVEPMEVDTEEEMSGLLISSTFSVCPTSGERVLPSTSEEMEMSDMPTVSDAAETPIQSFSNEDALSLSTNELISVPIQVQSSDILFKDFSGAALTVTPNKSKEFNLDETFKQVLSTAQEASSSAGSKVASTTSSTTIDNATSASKVCFAVKSKPMSVVENVKPESLAQGSVKKIKKTPASKQAAKSPPKPRITRKSSNSAKASKNTSSAKSLKPKEKILTEEPTKQTDEGKTKQKGKDESSSSNVSLIPLKEAEPAHDKVDIPEKKSEESSEKAAIITESIPTAEPIMEPVAAEKEGSSIPSSDTGFNVVADSASEDRGSEKTESESAKSDKSEDSKSDESQQSKNNPIRRSARLKSGV